MHEAGASIGEAHEGLTRVDLRVDGDHGAVPCVVWLPARRHRPPVVLLGHGGSGHKGSDRQERLATWLATAVGVACLAIDGPFHGDRAVTGDYRQRVVAEGVSRVHQRMRGDWLAALDAAGYTGLINDDKVGFLGMSMGARYGLPTCAALGPRLRCAVIGKFGLTSTAMLQSLAADDIIAASAAAIDAPVLMHIQWDDEVFPKAGQLQLFDLLASPQKELRTRTGGHGTTREDDEALWCAYLAGHLADPPENE